MSIEDVEQIKRRTGFDLRPTNREGVYVFAPPPEDFDPMENRHIEILIDKNTLLDHTSSIL